MYRNRSKIRISGLGIFYASIWIEVVRSFDGGGVLNPINPQPNDLSIVASNVALTGLEVLKASGFKRPHTSSSA